MADESGLMAALVRISLHQKRGSATFYAQAEEMRRIATDAIEAFRRQQAVVSEAAASWIERVKALLPDQAIQAGAIGQRLCFTCDQPRATFYVGHKLPDGTAEQLEYCSICRSILQRVVL